jgi:hypothetical protein
MGSTIGLYFPIDKDEVNALRARLNALAGELGYIAKAGPTAGKGNLAALLMAIDEDKIFIANRITELSES